jgi:butyrate kinase
MEKTYRILALNPGSTSTKVAVYENTTRVFETEVFHDMAKAEAQGLSIDDIAFRRAQIMEMLEKEGIKLESMDAVVGRGGFMKPVAGGIYAVNDAMIDDVTHHARYQHPSNLGVPLASEIAHKYGIPAFTVDPVVVDELDDIARISGVPGIERRSVLHALNIRAVARLIAEQLGKPYDQLNLIVVHMGGGISVSVHKQGRMVDVSNALLGMGPFSPQRSGALPIGDLVDLSFKYFTEGKGVPEMRKLLTKQSGLLGYLGTNDGLEIERKMEAGDKFVELVYKAMAYQTAKEIGAMATVVGGKLDAIVLTGGLARSTYLQDWIKAHCGFLAPFYFIPGQEEMATMARNAYEVLSGQIKAKEY